ncbi:MAG: type II toxin-antitoxin system VapC family toxin [Candidatus Acidiferrum sp.]
MIVLDANILLYAYDSSSTQHSQARTLIERIFSEDQIVGIPWQTVSAFLRIVTNPTLPGQRFSIEEASSVIDQWLEQPNVRFLAPAEEHWSVLRRLLVSGQVRGPMVTDAQLAALALENGGELYSTDRDFSRFKELRWSNPLD